MRKLFIAALMMLICTGAGAQISIPLLGIGEEESRNNSILYTTTDEKEVKFTEKESLGSKIKRNRYKDGSGIITCREEITGVGEYAFAGMSNLASVILPESVTSISDKAFFNCPELVSVEMVKGIASIGEKAFSGCYSLLEVVLYEGAESIGNYAFEGCRSMKRIVLPEGVKTIGSHAFDGCSSLESIVLPSSVSHIGSNAFEHCPNLKEIRLLSNSVTVEDYAFSGCTGSIYLACNLPERASQNFFAGSSFDTIELLNGVSSIGDYALEGYESMKCIVLPSSLEKVGVFALYGYKGDLKNYSSADILGNVIVYDSWLSPQLLMDSFGGHVIDSRYEQTTGYIAIDEAMECLPSTIFSKDKSLKSIYIPSGIKQIGPNAFLDCQALSSVTLPLALQEIGPSSFKGCRSLDRISIPAGVICLGDEAFEGCDKLSTVEFSPKAALTSIGNRAFASCAALSSIELPGSLSNVGYGLFSGCSAVLQKSVSIGNSVSTDSWYNGLWTCGGALGQYTYIEDNLAFTCIEDNGSFVLTGVDAMDLRIDSSYIFDKASLTATKGQTSYHKADVIYSFGRYGMPESSMPKWCFGTWAFNIPGKGHIYELISTEGVFFAYDKGLTYGEYLDDFQPAGLASYHLSSHYSFISVENGPCMFLNNASTTIEMEGVEGSKYEAMPERPWKTGIWVFDDKDALEIQIDNENILYIFDEQSGTPVFVSELESMEDIVFDEQARTMTIKGSYNDEDGKIQRKRTHRIENWSEEYGTGPSACPSWVYSAWKMMDSNGSMYCFYVDKEYVYVAEEDVDPVSKEDFSIKYRYEYKVFPCVTVLQIYEGDEYIRAMALDCKRKLLIGVPDAEQITKYTLRDPNDLSWLQGTWQYKGEGSKTVVVYIRSNRMKITEGGSVIFDGSFKVIDNELSNSSSLSLYIDRKTRRIKAYYHGAELSFSKISNATSTVKN